MKKALVDIYTDKEFNTLDLAKENLLGRLYNQGSQPLQRTAGRLASSTEVNQKCAAAF